MLNFSQLCSLFCDSLIGSLISICYTEAVVIFICLPSLGAPETCFVMAFFSSFLGVKVVRRKVHAINVLFFTADKEWF